MNWRGALVPWFVAALFSIFGCDGSKPDVRSQLGARVSDAIASVKLWLTTEARGGEPSSCAESPRAQTAAGVITVTVTRTVRHPISAYIYGVNSAHDSKLIPHGVTLDREGGNRWTAYNWETNASNAGSDYLYQNDSFLSTRSVPGEAIRTFIESAKRAGRAAIITVPLQGLVAGDKSGPVAITNRIDHSRFKHLVFLKSSTSSEPFAAQPSTTDDFVYVDEFLWTMDKAFGGQSIFGVQGKQPSVLIALDNEPELWPTTHAEVQGTTPITADAYIRKSIDAARVIKGTYPNAVILGPAHYGFQGIYSWQGELQAKPAGRNWFTDRYLTALKTASDEFGRPLIDAYDFHWYPEINDDAGHRITTLDSATLSDAQVQAIVQSPRSLWDPSFRENSWIVGVLGGPVCILGRIKQRVAAEYPSIKLAMTEYNNGGAHHIAGTIAQADNLGVFGAEDLYAASLWLMSAQQPYILAGFTAYRDFDGANSNFGDVSIQAISSDVQRVSAYASEDSKTPGHFVDVVINRSAAAQDVEIVGQSTSGSARLYQMTATSTKGQAVIHPVPVGMQPLANGRIRFRAPPLSVTTLDIR